jgi:thiamine-phosphate pyrophosphorylase
VTVDLRLYALLDPERAGSRALDDIARLIAPAATLVQLRDKHGTTRAMVEEARAIRTALPAQVPLLINDRVDVALAAQADGVHIGQDDMSAEDARRLFGPKAIIGLSLKSVAQATAAPIQHLDYVAIGGVFVTQSKDNPDAPVGLDGFKTILAAVRARSSQMPVTAIAGIDASNAADVIGAGADGVAIISALSLAGDPAKAARDLRGIIDGALAKRNAR